MEILSEINIYEALKISDREVQLNSLLGDKKRQKSLNLKDPKKWIVEGDLFLISENSEENIKSWHYPVKKIKGRYSDLKEYKYLKMKIMLDFYNSRFDKAIFHAEEKPAEYREFEEIILANKVKLKSYITYNSDEKVEPFNHTDYEVARILDGELIFEQEEGTPFDWQWNLMRVYKLPKDEYVSFKQSSIFRDRQRGEYFEMEKKYVDIMRTLEEDKDDFLD